MMDLRPDNQQQWISLMILGKIRNSVGSIRACRSFLSKSNNNNAFISEILEYIPLSLQAEDGCCFQVKLLEVYEVKK